MRKSEQLLDLLDQLKVHVLLYAGERIDYREEREGCERLITTAATIANDKVDRLLLKVEREAIICGLKTSDTRLWAPVKARRVLSA